MYFYAHDMAGGSHPVMWIRMTTFTVMVIIAAVLLARRTRDDPHQSAEVRTAEQVLAQRVARGDIDQTKYTTGQAALHTHTP